MKAVRKLTSKFVLAVSAAVGLCVLFCANPIDEPLKWRTKIEIPVTNNKFYLGLEMPGLLKNLKTENIDLLLTGISKTQSGKMYDTNKPTEFFIDTTRGDTVVFSILRKDSISYDTHEDTMETKLFHPKIGPITIANAKTINYSLQLPPGAGTVVTPTVNIPLDSIYVVNFDATSPDLSVTITNTSGVAITGGSITMLTVTRAMQDPLAAGASQTLTFPTANLALPGNLPVSVTETSVAAAGKGLTLSFNCNGLVTSFIRCDDHLVSFSKLFTNDYGLTDTLDVDYIDIVNGAFVYLLKNYTKIPLKVQATQLHLWDEVYMSRNNVWIYEDITRIANVDSLGSGYYWGNLTSGFTDVRADSQLRIITSNLAGTRLFPIWNDTITNGNGTKGKSVSRVTYICRNAEPRGDTATISAGDSLLFTIRAPNFKFKEMSGTVKRAYVREGDTAKIQVPFPFNKGSKDSLKGNFFLKHVEADIYMTPNLPDSTLLTPRKAFIDTLGVTYTLLNPRNPDTISRDSTKFLDVYNKKLFRHRLNMTNILNQWPDSMFILVKINIPIGTHLRAVTDLAQGDPEYPLYMGRMRIKAVNTVRMNAVLDWLVTDTAHLDLGSGKFPIGKAYKAVNKLQDRSFKFFMNAYNNTNVYINVYALAAPDSVLRKKLDTMSVPSTWSLIQNPTLANAQGFVSLLGNRGLRVPPRGRLDSSKVDLNDVDLEKILNTDTCNFRWQARFIPYETVHSDALHDTDYIDISSYVSVQGTNSMDSLLNWPDSAK